MLALLPDHDRQVLERACTGGAADEPLEVQLLRFASEDALDGFMQDERRPRCAASATPPSARTQVLRVDLV